MVTLINTTFIIKLNPLQKALMSPFYYIQNQHKKLYGRIFCHNYSKEEDN